MPASKELRLHWVNSFELHRKWIFGTHNTTWSCAVQIFTAEVAEFSQQGKSIKGSKYSILGCVLPLQEVALRQNLPSFSVLCYPHPYRSLLPHNVISPTTFWSSGWSYTLCLPLCASNSLSIIFHSGDVSSPFPFRVGDVLDYVCHFGSLPNGGVTNSVF